ncbi:MAG TPA: hypothetical protein VKS21_08235 [Spirochaetota bacterium]|nr:hypothetical protein [Spirochaetota bacterium]
MTLLLLSTFMQGRSLEEIRKDNLIRIGIHTAPGVYQKDDEEITGFHHDLAVELARYLKVKAKFIVMNYDDYFDTDTMIRSLPGVSNAASNAYKIIEKSIVFDKVDIICAGIVNFGNYKEIMNIIPLYPVNDIYLTHKNREIATKSKLKKKYIAVSDNPYLYTRALLILQDITSATILPSADNYKAIDKIVNKKANTAIIYSDMAYLISEMDKYDDIEIDQNLSASVNSTVFKGWGVQTGNTELANEVSFFIELIKKLNKKFEAYWRRTYNEQYDKYLMYLKNFKAD